MSENIDRPLELAILGCGAVTEIFHLPAARNSRKVRVKVLVDKDLQRARSLALKFGVPSVTDDWTSLDKHVEAALVALPPNLHAPVTVELLGRGIHTLVEKPMALSVGECDAMIAQARKSGAVLAVGLMKRFDPAFQWTKRSLEEGLIGEATAFDFREGRIYDWPLKTGFRFEKGSAGGGVLIDTGSHVADAVLWWLGEWRSLEYYDDAEGGLEANCELHLELRGGATGIVELSRTRNLRNSCIIRGTHGVLEVDTTLNSGIRLRLDDHDVALDGHAVRAGTGKEGLLHAFVRQLDDFADAVLNDRRPWVPGEEGRRSLELIEACYASRKPLALPWNT